MCKFFKHARNMNEIDRIYNALIKELGGPILDHVIIMARGRPDRGSDMIRSRSRTRTEILAPAQGPDCKIPNFVHPSRSKYITPH